MTEEPEKQHATHARDNRVLYCCRYGCSYFWVIYT